MSVLNSAIGTMSFVTEIVFTI